MNSPNKISRFLATTADEKTWVLDKPILFLGRWCTKESRREIWSKLDYEVVAYHWSDPVKMVEDSKLVGNIYENILEDFSSELNKLHNVNWSKRAWRILIGPWLSRNIEVLMDRWKSIEALSNYKVLETYHSKFEWGEMTPWNSDQLGSYSKNQDWNYNIYNYIINFKELNFIKTEKKDKKNSFYKKNNKVIKLNYLKNILKNILSKLTGIFWKNDNCFIFQSYFSRRLDLLKLNILLKNNPIKYNYFSEIQKKQYDEIKREKIILVTDKSKSFDCMVRNILPKIIPKIFIEGFEELLANVDKSIKCKSIFTTIAVWKNEPFKAFVATNVQNGTKLICGQHGGEYGSCLHSFFEEHEIKISDTYLTWGWNRIDSSTIRQVPMFLTGEVRPNFQKLNSNKINIICTHHGGFLSQMHHGAIIGDRKVAYQLLLSNLIEKIPENIKDNIYIRFFPDDEQRGDPLKDWFNRMSYNIKIDNNKKFIISEFKLIIYTYDGTPFLESIHRNYPCILYIDENISAIRSSAKPYYDKLKKVGILQTCSASLVKKLNYINNDILNWWDSKEVISAKNEFVRQFARRSDNDGIKEIAEAIVNTNDT